jgi:hypothetical protein
MVNLIGWRGGDAAEATAPADGSDINDATVTTSATAAGPDGEA